MATLREVAAAAGVSESTASKALNDADYGKIPEATRVRVREAAARVGYQPHALARALAGKRLNALGVVAAARTGSLLADPFVGPCLDGILEGAAAQRQKVVLFTETAWDDVNEERLADWCGGHCDGLMLLQPPRDGRVIDALRSRTGRRVPFILVGDSRPDDGIVTVDVDNFAASRGAVEYLLRRGHRRIAAVCGGEESPSTTQRLDGYRSALADAGIAYDPALAYCGEYVVNAGYDRGLRLCDDRAAMPPSLRPTAVFAFSDNIALGLLRAFAERGLHVPTEMSVVGFDDVPAAATAGPGGLTTVRQSAALVGQRSAETLLRLIQGEIADGWREWVPTELIVRGTVASRSDLGDG